MKQFSTVRRYLSRKDSLVGQQKKQSPTSLVSAAASGFSAAKKIFLEVVLIMEAPLFNSEETRWAGSK